MPQATDTPALPGEIDPDTALDQLILPPTTRAGANRRTYYLKETYDLLRSTAGETYSYGELRPQVIEGTYIASTTSMPSPAAWFRDMVAPHLVFLPGVEQAGGTSWRFDPASMNRPQVPDDPVAPPEDRVKQQIKQADLPGASTRGSVRHFCAIRDLYFDLQDRRTATREDLWHHAVRSPYQAPEDDKYTSGRAWWAALGRDALRDLPGVDPPIMPAGEWRYVGVDL